MDEAPALGRVLLLPLTAYEIVGVDFEEPLEDQGKALRGWFFGRKHLDVVVVNAEKPPVASNRGFAEVVVKDRVSLEPGLFTFQRREILNFFQNANSFVMRHITCVA